MTGRHLPAIVSLYIRVGLPRPERLTTCSISPLAASMPVTASIRAALSRLLKTRKISVLLTHPPQFSAKNASIRSAWSRRTGGGGGAGMNSSQAHFFVYRSPAHPRASARPL